MKIFHYLLGISLLTVSFTAMADGLKQENNLSSEVGKRSDQIDVSKLTPEEIEIYERGEISTGRSVGAGLLGTFLGLGSGHAVYGKYSSKGWIFTVGELGSYALLAGGLVSGLASFTSPTVSSVAMYFGFIGFLGFKIWEIVDIWTIPAFHNNRYRSIKERLEGAQSLTSYHISPLITQSQNVNGNANMAYGLQLGIRF